MSDLASRTPSGAAPSTNDSTSRSGIDRDAAERLRFQVQLFQSVFDSLADGVAAIDRWGRFVLFNPAGEAILGKGPFPGPSENWQREYGLFLPDRQTPFPYDQLPLMRAVKGEAVRDVEMFVRNDRIPEGRWLKVSATPVYDDRGEIRGAVALFRDDTAARRAEQMLAAERKFLRHLIQVQDRDRQLTAYDLHDGVVQLMTGALLRLEAFRGTQPAQQADGGELAAAVQLLREALDEARRMISGLRPPSIDDAGVVGAIVDLIDTAQKREGLKVEFVRDVRFGRLPPLVETTLFRIVQEALQNVVRHAGAKQARIELRQIGDQIHLEVRDWGRGFDRDVQKLRRYGVRGMEERARLLGGTASIESKIGAGTTVRVCLPMQPDSTESGEGEE